MPHEPWATPRVAWSARPARFPARRSPPAARPPRRCWRSTKRARSAPVADGLDDLDELDVVEDAAVRSKVVAFYDLDHTVIDTNSNKHWIAKEVKAGRVT